MYAKREVNVIARVHIFSEKKLDYDVVIVVQ